MPGDRSDVPPQAEGPGWRATLADPTVRTVLAFAALAIVAAIAAYLAIFTTFAPYDDEGTLLVTLQAFADGETLYRDVYSPYGPFYYELFGGFFALTGSAVTTDASRTIVIVVWVATSLLYGLAALRLTGRLALGAAGAIAAFGALYVLTGEPMHPQVLCVLLLGAFTLLAVGGPARPGLAAGAAGGALLAALTLTKLNLGAFAIAAVAVAAALAWEPVSRRPWLRWPVLLAFLAMPLAITARDLETGWVRELLALEVLASASVLVAAWPLRTRAGEDSRDLGRWLAGLAAGFAAAFVAIVAVILLTGPSPADVYDGVVVQAARVRDVLVSQFPFPPAALDWGIVALAGATLSVWLRRIGAGGGPTPWSGVLRIAAGVAIWLSVARIVPIGLNPSAENPITVPMLLAWVATIPVGSGRENSYARFLRVMLPALAVAQTLQVYPVSGSQMGIAALTFVPVGAICLADGIAALRLWSEARGGVSPQRFGATVAVATVALAGIFLLDSMLRGIADNASAYRDREALPFPGAGAMRPPPEETATYVELVGLLRENGCTTFAGYPNINSLYLWSGIEPPPPTAPGAWIKALQADQQQKAVDAMRASPRPCAIRSQARADLWLHGEPPPDRPLVRYLQNEFETVAEVGEFEFMLPKGAS